MSKEDLSNLLDIYRNNPCQTLPNAFWKTAKEMERLRLSAARDSDGALTFLAIQDDSRLMSYWCRKPEEVIPKHISVKDSSFALVHEDCHEIFKGGSFSQMIPYFRLLYTGGAPNSLCPAGYHYETVNPQEDLPGMALFINQCYENIRVNEKIVQSWLNHPVYDPDLWIWIKESHTKQLAALGIAEIGHSVPEASLEWIQVHPGYQRTGLGRALVGELLRRALPDVRFTTVSGEVNNPSSPEKLYRQAGFTGTDVWWMLRA